MWERYIDDVLSGTRLEGKPMRLQCQRHVDDLARQLSDDFPYYFDPKEAQTALDTFGMMRYPKGKKFAGRLFEPVPFQQFYIAELYGWRHVNGHRRYRKSHHSVAKKNAKSAFAGFVITYMAFFLGELEAEAYIAATRRDQTKYVYSSAYNICKFLRRDSPQFRQDCRVEEKAITVLDQATLGATRSQIMKLSADRDSIDGVGGICNVVDEYHAHPTDGVYENLNSAMKLMLDALLLSLTTCGFNIQGPCYELEEYCMNILEGVVQDDTFLPMMFRFDDDDTEWENPDMWCKTNPLLGTAIPMSTMLANFKTAKQRGGDALLQYKTKELNIWCESSTIYIPQDYVKASWSDDVNLEKFKGRNAIIGLDLASEHDISALTISILPDDDDPITYRFRKYYVPSDSALERSQKHKVNWTKWIESGHIVEIPGNTMDDDYVLRDILMVNDMMNLLAVGADSHNYASIAIKCSNHGINTVKVAMTTGTLNDGTKHTKKIHLQETIKTPKDEIYAYMISRTVLTMDSNENIKPDKNQSRDVIDAVVSDVITSTLYLDPKKYSLPEPDGVGIMWME